MVMMLILTACRQAEETQGQEIEWTIEIQLADGKDVAFTNLDMETIGLSDYVAERKNKEEMEEKQLTGVTFDQLLEHIGVEGYGMATVEAVDGYSREYVPEMLEGDGAILAIKVDGKDAEPIEFAVDGKGSNWWIKQVAKIVISD